MSQSQSVRAAPDLHILPGTPSAPVAPAVRIWLFAIAALCFTVAVVGAITRLTESGLSMVEWKPLIQDIPPLTEPQWQVVFGKYQLSPQYQQVTHGMSLAEFQGIFWWEWTHRLIAQLIGIAFALPFLWFLIRRQLPRRLTPYLVGLFILGGLQGLLGWAMVKSGLDQRPSVSHYLLASHLSLAMTLYCLTLWTAFFITRPRAALLTPAENQPVLQRHAAIGLGALAMTMVWGAFTAGLRAGMLYNTFPLMGGGFAPPDLLAYHPLWSNFISNPGAVQFVHRILAMITGLILLALALRLRAPAVAPELRKLATLMFGIVALQIGLGIETVLNQVPVWLGALHQANAIFLLGLTVRTLFLLRAPATAKFRPRLIVTKDAP
ncbi:MAG: cytochrome oxidase assembly protein [Rhodospirillales bacterium]|nr:cytochrome oxidase assembly protein [Rhodospirillales bacterium]